MVPQRASDRRIAPRFVTLSGDFCSSGALRARGCSPRSGVWRRTRGGKRLFQQGGERPSETSRPQTQMPPASPTGSGFPRASTISTETHGQVSRSGIGPSSTSSPGAIRVVAILPASGAQCYCKTPPGTRPRGGRRGWGREDSNLRRRSQPVYSRSPLATRELPREPASLAPTSEQAGPKAPAPGHHFQRH